MTTPAAPFRRYRLFDVRVRSNHALVGVPERPDGPAAVHVRVSPDGIPRSGFAALHTWRSAGRTVLECARRDDDYLLQFPGLGAFHIRAKECAIEAFPPPDASAASTSHLLVDQVIPRLLGHRGRCILHASAVALPDGRGIAFLGDTGRGKSTLAASFLAAGACLISDDCLLLEGGDSGVACRAAYPGLRLWPDSLQTLPAGGEHLQFVTHYSSKRQVVLTAGDARTAAGRVPLAAIFVLEEASADRKTLVRPLGGAAAAVAMIEAAFVLDVVSPAPVRENFARATHLARSGLRAFALHYPRDFAALPEVQEQVLARVRG